MFETLEQLELPPLRRLSHQLTQLVEGRLWLKILLGMAGGAGAGMLLGPDAGIVSPKWAVPIGNWAALPGSLFLALIQMIVVPLVFASIIRGLTASDNVDNLRRLGLRAIALFVVTTGLAAALGIGLAVLVEPGSFVTIELPAQAAAPASDPVSLPGVGELPERVVGLLPRNPLASMVGGEMLQVILFAVVLGIALLSLPRERSAPLYDLLGSLQDACMAVVRWAMRLAPLAVFGLTVQLTATVGIETLAGLAVYVVTVIGGLLVMFVLYLVGARVLAGQKVGAYLSSIRELLLLAFSTSSSAAVMPMSLETCEDRLGIRPSIARLVLPLGATVNMTGTALYQAVATVFLAQLFGIELNAASYSVLVATAVAASIGSPAAPGVGMVILAMILESVGVPPAGAVLLLGVDRVLDMSRTVVNVLGDVTTCAVLERWEPPTTDALQGTAPPGA